MMFRCVHVLVGSWPDIGRLAVRRQQLHLLLLLLLLMFVVDDDVLSDGVVNVRGGGGHDRCVLSCADETLLI